ncbi:hypothetical protein BDV96DRAFT_652998 [Lophiotrema nucula]|uniref:Uncharacterized protein n=1 Tax=Lophiotrema nucula TaxID=690887 RepID=A0A6A5YNY5_9PLEO|nr:hypothetical protein BDV96DRAFT_652998 [Lophiotrema nucula]
MAQTDSKEMATVKMELGKLQGRVDAFLNEKAEAIQEARNHLQGRVLELEDPILRTESKELAIVKAENARLQARMNSFEREKKDAVKSALMKADANNALWQEMLAEANVDDVVALRGAKIALHAQIEGLNARVQDQAMLVKTADENSQKMGWSSTYKSMYNAKCKENDELQKELGVLEDYQHP